MQLYVVFGDYTDKLCNHLRDKYKIVGKDRTLEAAVAVASNLSKHPDAFLVLGSALVSGLVEDCLDYGTALVSNLAKLHRVCPESRIIVILSASAGESLVQSIVKLGIYDIHCVEKVTVGELIEFIDNPKTFADYDVDVEASGDPGEVKVEETVQDKSQKHTERKKLIQLPNIRRFCV